MKEIVTRENLNLAATVDPLAIIDHFYPEETPLSQLLLKHGKQVRDKALSIAERAGVDVDLRVVSVGALLHDIGILRCHAPKILCEGQEPYIAHGIIGAEMLRDFGRQHGLDLEAYARICERHTGSGLTAAEVRGQGLPIPERDYQPETAEEKLICLADKFFSKSGDRKEKKVERIRHSLAKFGADSVARFDEMCRFFDLER